VFVQLHVPCINQHNSTDKLKPCVFLPACCVLSVGASTAILIPLLSILLHCLVSACLQGVFAPNERLLHAVRLFEGQVKGPGEQSQHSRPAQQAISTVVCVFVVRARASTWQSKDTPSSSNVEYSWRLFSTRAVPAQPATCHAFTQHSVGASIRQKEPNNQNWT
jgi:hypothetical protein